MREQNKYNLPPINLYSYIDNWRSRFVGFEKTVEPDARLSCPREEKEEEEKTSLPLPSPAASLFDELGSVGTVAVGFIEKTGKDVANGDHTRGGPLVNQSHIDIT